MAANRHPPLGLLAIYPTTNPPPSALWLATGRAPWARLGEMDPRDEPVDVVVKRDEGVTITFVDDHVAAFDLMELRLGCPCATCRTLRDAAEDVWPRPGSPTPLRIENATFHGAWGLNIAWNDGHGTGIYPFEALRRWSEGGPAVAPDSGLPGSRE